MIEFANNLTKGYFFTFILTLLSTFCCFVALITPSWQVAEDLDAHRSVQSGLWIYCSGASQCWYIFSDTLINYYERVDVCRFLLIGDCRKKLLRTPYFFGWHYAIFILILVTLSFLIASLITILIAYYRPKYNRILICIFDIALLIAFLLLCIALVLFIINAEMLESRYLIGIKNTFEKTYGYSFYLACFGLLIMFFAIIGAVLITTWIFFFNQQYLNNRFNNKQTLNYVFHPTTQETKPQFAQPFETVPRYCYSPSEISIPTRTFLSY